MKQIPLETKHEELVEGQPELEFSYADVLLDILRYGGSNGVTIEEMEKRLRIIDAIRHAKEQHFPNALLEDEDHRLLCSLVNQFRFRIVTLAAVEMRNAILNAETVEVKAT